MDHSIFLAKALGIYLIFISIAFVVKEQSLKARISAMMSNQAFLMAPGVVAFIIGILLVVSHNLWVEDWRVLITIIGWMALLKGMTIILFPDFMINWSSKWLNNKFAYYLTFLFVFLVGSCLIYHGYLK